MDFGLSEEQELLQDTVREFMSGELPPTRLREIFESGSGHDPALWRGAAEVGLCGLIVPERFGGAGLELLDLALAFEILGAAAMPGPFLGHALACVALAHGASDAQRERWLPRLASGEAIASVALAEPGDAWTPETWSSKLTGERISGEKHFVECAHLADLLVVGTAGGELALVEGGSEGVQAAPVDGVDRTRALAHLQLNNAVAEPLPRGTQACEALLDAGRILLAADAFGAAWKLLDLTVEYTKTREQFGMPIAQFQAVKHQLANLVTELESTRGLFWYAAHAFDHRPAERGLVASAAKAHITDVAVDVGRSAVELHGGIGFTWECDVQFWVKRTMFDRTYLGGLDAQLDRLAQLGDW
jgi:alkylation response protein AidB-like acyl-CoA dehydrogenase